jgi:hypothetical protein
MIRLKMDLKDRESKVYMQESCCMAGILYSNMTLWGFQPPMHFCGDLAIILKQALLRTDLETFWNGDVWEDILLWILLLSGYGALKRPEREWFLGLLAKMEKERQSRRFEDVKVALVRVIYNDGLEMPFEMLWKEVEVSLSQRNRCTFVEQVTHLYTDLGRSSPQLLEPNLDSTEKY